MTISKSHFTEKSQMFKGFFLLLKASYVISLVMILSMLEQGLTILPFLLFGILVLAGEFVAATFAERLIKADNQIGLFIGLFLAVLTTFSFFFPIGLFGLYALLNKDFRNDYLLSDRPNWLSSFYEQLDRYVASFRSPKGT